MSVAPGRESADRPDGGQGWVEAVEVVTTHSGRMFARNYAPSGGDIVVRLLLGEARNFMRAHSLEGQNA